MAVALQYGFVSLKHFTPEFVLRPEVRRLIPLTTMDSPPPEAELNPAGEYIHELTVNLKSGEILKTSRTAAKGTLGDPLSDQERRRKFNDCCLPVLGDTVSADLYSRCNDLGNCTNLRDFLAATIISDPRHANVA
tara:strand:- start:418 stop:822 length:405 start_codon:yes stop_codon:yes gene_type:complete